MPVDYAPGLLNFYQEEGGGEKTRIKGRKEGRTNRGNGEE